MKTVFAVGLGLVLLFYLGLCAWLFMMQRDLLYHPQPRMPVPGTKLSSLLTPAGPVHVTVWPGSETSPAESVVLYLGGNAEDTAASVPALARAFPGHDIYALHYRGWGGSAGSPTEAALVADAIQWFDEVGKRHASVTVIGRSLGSGIAVQLAAQRTVHRLVLVTPYDSVLSVVQRAFFLMPVSWLLKDRYMSVEMAPKVSAPTLMVAAAEDNIIPPDHATALLNAFAPGIARMVLLPGVGHNDISLHPDYWQLLAGRK
ncbi:MAG: alpha/beta fold hydrolase [Lautropia sp.]|nr:alpha/beta fold hydrolase [Lautropia sp.]